MKQDISNLSVTSLKDGFSFDSASGLYTCLFCDTVFEEGEIYFSGKRGFDARKTARLHVNEAHGSVFAALLAEGKKHTGLTDTQSTFFLSFYNGKSDTDIAQETGSSPSTVRYQRYTFREKAKQAKIMLALSSLMEEKTDRTAIPAPEIPSVHETATMVDERYMTTGAEADRIIKNFFSSINPPVLKIFSAKEKNKLVILKVIAEQFKHDKKYSEIEVNEILSRIYSDHVTIRRFLIDYGFLGRTRDCKEYWRK